MEVINTWSGRGALWNGSRCYGVGVERADAWLHGGDPRDACDLTDKLGDADQITVCLCASTAGLDHPDPCEQLQET